MLTMRRIADALLAAKKRGVIVRIITDKSMIGTSNSQINILQREGKLISNKLSNVIFFFNQ